MKLNPNDIKAILKKYYQDFEEKEVDIEITLGKVISSETYLPRRTAIYFGAVETVNINGNIEKQKTPLSTNDVERMISSVLEKSNYKVTDIQLEMDQQNPNIFKGMTISGEKVVTDNKKI